MFALFDATGKHVATVKSLAGVNMTGLTSRAATDADNAGTTEAELLQRIERERQRAVAKVLTPGKDVIYVAKQAEISAFDTMGEVAALALPAPQRTARFPYASGEMAVRSGATLKSVIESFRAGAAASTAALVRIEGLTQTRIAAVKAAKTTAAKHAAFSSTPSI